MLQAGSVGKVAKDLDLTESALREWVRQAEEPATSVAGLTAAERKDLEEKALLDQVREAHYTSRGIYGSLRIRAALKRRGLTVSRHRVARLMRQHGLRGRVRRRYRCTTDR